MLLTRRGSAEVGGLVSAVSREEWAGFPVSNLLFRNALSRANTPTYRRGLVQDHGRVARNHAWLACKALHGTSLRAATATLQFCNRLCNAVQIVLYCRKLNLCNLSRP